MSTHEQLFFDPGHDDPAEAARALARALGWTPTLTPATVGVSTERLSDDLPFPVGGDVDRNVYSDVEPQSAEEEAVYDGLPMVWSIRAPKTVGEQLQRTAARTVFQTLAAASPGWPMVLTHGFAVLEATFDPTRGLRTFPDGTLSDGSERYVWA